MAIIRNDCVLEESTLSFQINNNCTSLEYLNDLIIKNTECCDKNTKFIQSLYYQFLDLQKVVKFLNNRVSNCCNPYQLCVTPASTQIVSLRPAYKTTLKRQNIIKSTPLPIIVEKTNLRWVYTWAYSSKQEVPILGVGNFYIKGDTLVDNNGKDLREYLPVHFGKRIGDIFYVGICNYRVVKNKDNVYYWQDVLLDYQIYDIKTGETKIFSAGIFQWKKIAENNFNFI